MKPFWTPIDPDNLPEGKVLAACFEKSSTLNGYKLYGKISKNPRLIEIPYKPKTPYRCDYVKNTLFDITHYHDIDQYDKKIE